MAYLHSTVKIAALTTLLLITTPSYSASPLAIQDFKTALSSCERVIQEELPRSRGSLRIMQSLIKRYQRNIESALRRAPELKDSTQLYNGGYFVELAFSEAYQFCETNLPSRLEDAEQEMQRILEERRERQAENQALLKKLEQKQAEIAPFIETAINNNCVPVINNVSEIVPPEAEQNYLTAKQEIIARYPEAVRQFHTVKMEDPFTAEAVEETKPLKIWFETCEEAFAMLGQEPAPVIDNAGVAPEVGFDEEGPMLPPVQQAELAVTDEGPLPPGLASAPIATDAELEDSYQAELEAEYEAALERVSGDRKRAMQEMGRIPDYVNHDDGDLTQASIWQYETPAGDHCDMFEFNGDQQIDKQTLSRECPPF